MRPLVGFPAIWMACGNSHSVVVGGNGVAMAFGLNNHGQVLRDLVLVLVLAWFGLGWIGVGWIGSSCFALFLVCYALCCLFVSFFGQNCFAENVNTARHYYVYAKSKENRQAGVQQ